MEFLYPERTHDYDPAWDYQLERRPDQELKGITEAARADLTRTLLPRLGIFAGFDVHFVKHLRGRLGRYVDGTVSRPAVVLCLKAIRDACDEYGLDYELGVVTTIVHELGHAVQESKGLPPNEAEAEAFARAWWERREILLFRQAPDPESGWADGVRGRQAW
jgi:hypothetical protein